MKKTKFFIKIDDLIPGLDPSMLPEMFMEGKPITTKKGLDYVSVEAGHTLEEGDYPCDKQAYLS